MGNIYFSVYITGPGVDREVTHPMCRHITNTNPISLKDWALCLHMGPKWDYPLLNRCSENICSQGCCPVTLASLLVLCIEGFL